MRKCYILWLCLSFLIACTPPTLTAPSDEHFPQAFALGHYDMILQASLMRSLARNQDSVLEAFSPCARVTRETSGNLLKIRLGYSGDCPCQDGRTRSGTLTLLMDRQWPAPGTRADLLPTGYQIQTLNGTIANLTTREWQILAGDNVDGTFATFQFVLQDWTLQINQKPISWEDTLSYINLGNDSTPRFDDDIYTMVNTFLLFDGTNNYIAEGIPILVTPGECAQIRTAYVDLDAGDSKLSWDFGQSECATSITQTDVVGIEMIPLVY